MKITRVIFAVLMLLFCDTFMLIAQTPAPSLELKYLNDVFPFPPPREVNFTIKNLPKLNQFENTSFKGDPFYEALIIYGDGNFKREQLGSTLAPNEYNLKYSYRDLENSYPALVLMIRRKDDEDPPEPDGNSSSSTNFVLSPRSTPDNNLVNINGQSAPTEPITSNVETSSKPPSPMLPEGNNNALAIGLSHFSPKGGYFLEENSIHTVLLAYRPVDYGIILFYYQDDPAGEEFEYYKNITLTNNGSSVGVGTITPNYGTPPDGMADVMDRMKEISEFTSGSPFLPFINGSEYDNGVAHLITEDDVALLGATNGILSPGELRLFHFIKTGIFKSEGTANFLAVLYDNRDEMDINLDRLGSLNQSSEPLDFPPTFNLSNNINPNININLGQKYKFADYSILTANKGEPNDPGGLVIEKIRKDGDEYVVSFKLTFCNADNASASATMVDIFLESYPINRPYGNPPLFTDFQILSNRIIPTLPPDKELQTSKKVFCDNKTSMTISSPDNISCYTFDLQNSLAQGECGAIQFSARINETEAYRLTQESVMRYCVQFDQIIEGGEFCLPNEIIQDTICVIDTTITPNTVVCTPNPIWTDRDQLLHHDIWYTRPWCLAAMGIGIGCIFLFFIKRRKRKHKKRKHKKHS